MPGVSRCCVFSGSVILFVVFFLIRIPYLLVLLGILSGLRVVCSSLR